MRLCSSTAGLETFENFKMLFIGISLWTSLTSPHKPRQEKGGINDYQQSKI